MLRMAFSLGVITIVTLALIPVQWLAVRLEWPLRRRIPTFYHRIVCRVLGIRITEIGRRVAEHPLLIVSNHTSWLDISVITAVAPVVFVAKSEVANWPVFGLFAKLQRSVFVDRNRRRKTADVNSEIARRLAGGDPVVLFGEGTSSDGNRVLAFRTALVGAARDALAEAEHAGRVWIQPLSVAYTGLLGLPLDRHVRPRVAWYGDAAMWPHFSRLVAHSAVDVVVTWGEPLAYDEASDRKAAARQMEQAVRRLTVAALRGRAAEPAGTETTTANSLLPGKAL
ncbi:MAG TPA: lysophospholipid acyltransferase family protein [Xanthobacteraceae bacterium]|nr:lysophospholipid acyltransferase family protein [Xanthobacteraceae bacterium]